MKSKKCNFFNVSFDSSLSYELIFFSFKLLVILSLCSVLLPFSINGSKVLFLFSSFMLSVNSIEKFGLLNFLFLLTVKIFSIIL